MQAAAEDAPDEDAAEAAVAIGKGVNGLELGMGDGCHPRRHRIGVTAGVTLQGGDSDWCLASPMRATLCYMKEITHRQMRNDSADVLRRVAAGETILVTNNGQPAAVIGPPPSDVLALLSAQGQLRKALTSPDGLRSIKRRRSNKTTAEIIADVRGRW